MHEMGIALQVIRVAAASIPPELKGSRVERIFIKVGKFSAVVPESLVFCFNIAARQTPFEGAEIRIEEIPAVARCRTCAHEWQVEGPAYTCPGCGSGDLDIVSGNELEVASLEIAEEPTGPEED